MWHAAEYLLDLNRNTVLLLLEGRLPPFCMPCPSFGPTHFAIVITTFLAVLLIKRQNPKQKNFVLIYRTPFKKTHSKKA